MAFFQWRRFNFFDVVKDVDEGSLRKALQLVQVGVVLFQNLAVLKIVKI